MQVLSLTTPQSVTNFQIDSIFFDWVHQFIRIVLHDTQGKLVTAEYSGDVATTLMRQLNKLDLSTNSLHKRILERLATDEKLPAGTVTGSPD